jgi:hypothetical protein
MHSHVIRTTTKDLAPCLDEWASTPPIDLHLVGPRRPQDVIGQVTPHYVGGRDWVVTVIHEHAAIPDHSHEHGHNFYGTEDPAALDAIGTGTTIEGAGVDAARVGPLVAAKVHGGTRGDDGSVMPPPESVMIEDANHTWVMWCDASGRPSVMWLRREATGAVLDGSQVVFSDTEPGGPGQVVEIPGWDVRALKASRDADPDDCPEPDVGEPENRSWGELVRAPSRTNLRYRLLYGDGRTQFLDYRPIMGPGDVLLERDDTLGWRVVATWPGSGPVTDHPTVDEVADRAVRASAEAYHDAVASLQAVTRAPLSTTIGHLIRQGWLRPANPRGKFFVRWEDGGITVDAVPVPGKPGQWDKMRYLPVEPPTSTEARRDLVSAVAITIGHLTGLPVDEAVLG